MMAVLFVVILALSSVAVSHATPLRQDLANARGRLEALNQRLDLLVEQYNQVNVALQQAERRLAELQAFSSQAKAQAQQSLSLLSQRVALAYTETTSYLEVLLGSETLSQFSDRLDFLGSVSHVDLDLANQAQVKKEIADRAAADVQAAITKKTALLEQLSSKKSEIVSAIHEQQELIVRIEGSIARAEAARRAAERRAAAQRAAAQRSAAVQTAILGGTASSSSSYGSPPPASSAASIAVRAAYSVLGVPYQWGGASPETGFDCSGLTMWAWAQAGVSLPHSSALQYSVLPHVSRSQLQPGDLVFFYSPISHVGIYVGNDTMIHAPHTGSVVELTRVSTYPDYVGAGRPG